MSNMSRFFQEQIERGNVRVSTDNGEEVFNVSYKDREKQVTTIQDKHQKATLRHSEAGAQSNGGYDQTAGLLNDPTKGVQVSEKKPTHKAVDQGGERATGNLHQVDKDISS